MSEVKPVRVNVNAPARLHMGFLDMHGGLGRSFGSLGLCLDNISTRITVSDSHRISAEGTSAERAQKLAATLIETLNIDGGVHIEIEKAIPEHIGLGSGTQLSLAVGMGISRLKGLNTPIQHIARLLGRGDRSGIGIGSFKYGGFLVDGGRSSETDVPPITSHMTFPDAWRIMLIFDNKMRGVHGEVETTAFKAIEPMSENVSERICRLLLMQVLPALAEEDCSAFGSGITEVQQHIGDYFSKWQGGRYCSKEVAEVLSWVQNVGSTGFGQSSWGPTGFAIFANETQAYQALKQAREQWPADSGLEFMISKARNQMADVIIHEPESSYTMNLQEI